MEHFAGAQTEKNEASVRLRWIGGRVELVESVRRRAKGRVQ